MGDPRRESDVLLVLDPARRIATASPGALRLLGLKGTRGLAIDLLLTPTHPLLPLIQIGQSGTATGRIELDGHPWWMRVHLCADGWLIVQGSQATEAVLRVALEEARLLQREAQHRARNQLQALLALARRNAGEAPWFHAFEATVATSMVLQDRLQLPDARGRVDSATFLRRVVAALPVVEHERLALAAGVDLPAEVAARLGMIVAQFASTSVALVSRGDAETIIVEVEGRELPHADLELCVGLAAQLGGSVDFAEGPPWRAVVVLPR